MFFLLEFCLAVLALGLAFAFPNLGRRWFQACEAWFSSIATRRWLSVLLVGVSALVVRAALLPVETIPYPGVQDEFSQLLAADTFAHGRATNPTHPLWIHFETLSVIQQPTYTSKYPPAPPLLMAAGQVIGGNPFWGVWFGVGLMCGAICWMLQGWLPETWALLGGFLAIIRFGSFSYWADSYWGGAVAAFAGALIIGALPRIKKDQRIRDSLLMALGLGILANTRPFEGLCFSIPVLLSLAWWFSRDDRSMWPTNAKHVLAPMMLLLILFGLGTGYYFWRVTGSPFRMPYQVYQATYDPMPYFIWQRRVPLPMYRHPAMQAWELGRFDDWGGRTVAGFLLNALLKILRLVFFYAGPVFVSVILFALAVGPYDLRWRQISPPLRLFIIISATMLVAFTVEAPGLVHYMAPATGVFIALIMLAMRYLRGWTWHGTPVGQAFCHGVVLTVLAMFVARVAAGRVTPPFPIATWCTVAPQDSPNLERAKIANELQVMSGKQLVIVHYYPQHLTSREWVYNAADIDGSKVVWAQDMGPEKNQELIDYYKDRQVWLVLPDETRPRLLPYADYLKQAS